MLWGGSEAEIDRRTKEAAAVASLATEVAGMKAQLAESIRKIETRDQRYFELAEKLNNLCESGHKRISDLESHARKVNDELASTVRRVHLEDKIEKTFGVDCTKPEERDKSRAAYKQMMAIDFERLRDMLKIDPLKVGEAVEFVEGYQDLKSGARTRLLNWILAGIGTGLVAIAGWAASGWHWPER